MLKYTKSIILLALVATGLVSCSSAATEPVADSSTAPESAPKPAPTPTVKMVAIPAETPLEVLLNSSLSSDKSAAGDAFEATLAAPLIIDGTTVLEKGAMFHGRVVAAEGSARVKGLASLTLDLTEVVHDGKATPITTKNWTMQAKSTKKKDAAKIGIGAGIGTAIGAIAGGGKGAAEGAAIGAGGGTGVVLATKGDEVKLGPEARLKFVLENSVKIPK